MQKLKYTILATLLLHLTEAWSYLVTFPLETPTNATSIPIIISGCEMSNERYIGTEVEEGVINVYIYAGSGMSPCPIGPTMDLYIGPYASGNYTFNFYEVGTYNRDNLFNLWDSRPVTIEKVSENEPPLGHVIVSGEIIEDQTVTASHTLSDSNGMGEVHYRWYRNNQAIPGAVSESYLLIDDDVDQRVTVTANFVDGQGNAESVSSLAIGIPDGIANVNDEPIGSVYIRGSVSEGSTLTIDSSGLHDPDGIGNLSYQWKRRYRAFSANDQDIGLDSDTYVPNANDSYYLITAIVSYTDLHRTLEHVEANVTGRVVPPTQPVVTAPADLSTSATGTLTLVDVGTATAHDDQVGELETVLSTLVSNGVNAPLPSDGLLYLQPGTHLLTWSVADGDGVTGEAIQIVRVDPIIEFGGDHAGTPEGPFSCALLLNGSAAKYPISVPYTVSATLITDQSQKMMQEGILRIDGNEQSPAIQITPEAVIGDVADYESLILEMDQPTNAVMGDKNSCRIILSQDNFPPRVRLNAYQEEVTLRIVSQANGLVTVSSTVDDLNTDDTHTYDWSGTDEGLMDIDSQEDSLTFDPTSLEPGLYRVRLRVSDGSAAHGAELSIRVVTEGPELSGVDSDGDGESDLDEGIGDRDGDGIPDYLDHAGLLGNILPQEQGNTTQYLMETESGLTLVLGDIAFFTQRHAAMITDNDILDYIDSGLGGETDSDAYPYRGGLFDFRINGIPGTGASVKVVIHQQQMIEADSIYRKLMPTGWRAFVEDDNNEIRSVLGEAGQCPSPGDDAYTEGLTEGDWCVELTIEDGGPNDADGQANGTISDPGGVTTILSTAGGSQSNGGGGGAFSMWLLSILVFFTMLFQSVRRSHERTRLI